MTSDAPILIAGQGLAGTAVAWQLWQRNRRFLIVDPDEPQTSSKVAAGLVTPITGMRLNLSWRIATLLPEALEFYKGVGTRLGENFYHSTPHVRLFKNERETGIWATRSQSSELQPWLATSPPQPLVDPEVFHAELGGFQQQPAGWLDTAAYLEASRAFFQKEGFWQQGTVDEGDLEVASHHLGWEGKPYDSAVFCRGWAESQGQRYFPWLKFDSARGAIVTVKTDLAENRILNRGAWMLPRSHGTWRAGSTYEFDFKRPLEESVEEVRKKLSGLLRAPFEITHAQTGIRPIIKRVPGVLGRHPGKARVAILNGLGSKGVLRAPAFSRMLVDHLLGGFELEAELDVRSYD